MWINELSKVYVESNAPWGPFTVGLPGNARGVPSATETKNSFERETFAQGKGNTTFIPTVPVVGEQEEDEDLLLDFDKWWKSEGGLYNFPSPEVEEASKNLAYKAWKASKDFYNG